MTKYQFTVTTYFWTNWIQLDGIRLECECATVMRHLHHCGSECEYLGNLGIRLVSYWCLSRKLVLELRLKLSKVCQGSGGLKYCIFPYFCSTWDRALNNIIPYFIFFCNIYYFTKISLGIKLKWASQTIPITKPERQSPRNGDRI